MKRSLLWLLIAVLSISLMATFSLAGCKEEASAEEEVEVAEEDAPEEEAAEETSPAEEEVLNEGPFTMAWVAKGLGHPYFISCFEGAKEAALEFGDEIFEVGPDDWSVEGQIAIMESLIDQEVDVIGIAANDLEALAPVCKKAMDAGIHVMSWDAPVNQNSRETFVNQISFEDAGRYEIQAIGELIDYQGQIAILSASPQAPNQRKWVNWMYEEMKDPKYAEMEIVDVVFGDDQPEKGYDKVVGLLKAYPELRGIVSPTAAGLPEVCAVITDKGLVGKIETTGLALPSSMKDYVLEGACNKFYLWNTIDLGYVAATVMHYLGTGEFTGAVGETFKVGRPTLGAPDMVFEVIIGEDGDPFILLGPPMEFNKDNIEEWADIF